MHVRPIRTLSGHFARVHFHPDTHTHITHITHTHTQYTSHTHTSHTHTHHTSGYSHLYTSLTPSCPAKRESLYGDKQSTLIYTGLGKRLATMAWRKVNTAADDSVRLCSTLSSIWARKYYGGCGLRDVGVVCVMWVWTA